MSINKFLMVIFALIFLAFFTSFWLINKPEKTEPVFKIRSIDTVKYSRDLASQMLGKKDFDNTIKIQVSEIASVNTTHIGIGTPYDDQFKPFLKRWIDESRAQGLKVWFRGNFSGWEGWFGYKKITRQEHLKELEAFILSNPDLFEDGDIFTPCPECENGGPGDPRQTGDAPGFRQFLVDEYNTASIAFGKINKKVTVGYFSMNYDVADLIMDRETTHKLGDVVVIDHYIKDPSLLAKDARKISEKSGGKVVLGEFGVPIPDIHGNMSEDDQAKWIEKALEEAKKTPEIIGINYWVNVGGSTRLWNEDGSARKAVEVIKKFFNETKITQSS